MMSDSISIIHYDLEMDKHKSA